LQLLSRKKILHSSKGPHGGFNLAISAEKLTLMDIIEGIDSGDFFDSCYVTGERCNFDQTEKGVCILHDDLRKEKDHLAKFFNSKTIGDIVNQVTQNPEIVI
jgi:Rrf2 family iron-sulfur cluster assembly transcriptional regulator